MNDVYKDDYCVYKHTSPDGLVYIGITKNNPIKRWNNGNGYKKNIHFYEDILKYKWENFDHDILEVGLSKRDAYKKEVQYIKKYNSANPIFGYNNTYGGNGLLPPHAIQRLRESHKNRQYKNKINKICTESDTKRKDKKINKYDIEELKKFYRQCTIGKHGKPIYCYENNKAYKSIQEASEQLSIGYNSINLCVLGKQNSANKLHFIYLLDLIHDTDSFFSFGKLEK